MITIVHVTIYVVCMLYLNDDIKFPIFWLPGVMSSGKCDLITPHITALHNYLDHRDVFLTHSSTRIMSTELSSESPLHPGPPPRVRFVTIYVKMLILELQEEERAIGAFCQWCFLYKSIDCLAVDSRNYGKRWKSLVKCHQKVVKVGSGNWWSNMELYGMYWNVAGEIMWIFTYSKLFAVHSLHKTKLSE